ncbi:hypothetical protein A2673_02995 [Candidatus Kaiserbacteria bacterium RIFCSPHIGHO2_01_FULL_50_13]|uniref:Type 4 fimbrial biogenesis protein PilX N-terminal domain-containing protein n=1 Tax=Candidatus Kaiserbacteria bacterium RIFCSPLOWO2_01_FULL_50_24 TaxID=1798507 RepID=A0A1F6ERD3_9BACT|nr:MAG: hypothetical protein A2673_02995 [Candidatus Kaiserbacteria bacterium RIFCSPHIGHO2_01_FULL_50_13]OGG76191.1 MAG: hypothetical protein A3A34_01730 [Candidatus Kaiserbacteria bacterium RIFCSPLOWO2_01_FULL_50_24]OGG81133.1 MAG: hypothetical protein A3H74_01610 [Candidatus Kaiserbacteria bacterium RIFCSPLOWO2_02_FULL_51_13]
MRPLQSTIYNLRSSSRGVTVLLVLGFMGVFALILGALGSYALTQAKYGRAIYAREVAQNAAEAGLEYYRWFLAHNPEIMEGGAGLVSPYTYTLSDPEGGELGSAEITASAQLQCGAVQWVDIVSEGRANANPIFPRTLSARYMQYSAAEYSYVVNTNVWAGSSRTIRGPYHSNGGVRMDAVHNSDVMSSVASWTCDAGPGCPSTQAGVFGVGSNPALWTYPVPSIDFSAIGVNFTDLETRAETEGGIHYGPATGSVNNRGYHVIFNADGTVTIYRVTGTNGYLSYSSQWGYQTQYSIITGQTLLGTFAIPPACSLMFFEDRVWVEGTVNGKVTLIAATPDDSSTAPDIYLNNNIYYASYDGSDGLTLVAERNVLLPLVIPDVMEIHGIFVAQSGHYGRDYHSTSWLPSQYDPYAKRDTLTTIGTVISNGRTGTSWTDGNGFQTRNDYYDQRLAFSPPPFTPITSTDYRFALWREK